ncbi:MAG: DUF4270 family protein [Bacteroidota bacterium]
MKYLYSCLCLLLLASCSNDPENLSLTVGEEFNDLTTRVLMIDTLQIKASTFKFDSIITSNTTRILVGSYTDAVFGKTTSDSYLELVPTDGNFDLRDDAVYDSIALIMRYDRYFYNDTIPQQRFTVHEVTDNIRSDNDAFYNTTTFETNPIPIGDVTFEARPTKGDSLHISLDHAYGQLLFDRLEDNTINDIDDFLNRYKGIHIRPDTQNTAVLGFSPSFENTFIRLYYTVPDEIEDQELQKDFSVNNSKLFNHIESDRAGTIFQGLNDQENDAISSLDTNNKSYIQSGTGIALKIEVPHVKNLFDVAGENGVLMSAKLRFKPTLNSYTQNLTIRDSLLMFILDRNTEVESQVFALSGEPVYATMEDQNDEFNTLTYNAPIDFFVQTKLQERFEQNTSLSFYPLTFNSSVDRFIIDGEGSSNSRKITLEITYAVYEEEE